MAYAIAMQAGQRAERKSLITVATWKENETTKTAILGARTEDSSIEFNGDVETSTDVLGINYTDLGKTQPVQSFDPAYIIGGDALMAYMNAAALANKISAYNGVFDVYIVAAYLTDGASKYYTVKHSGCSIIPQSLGGDSFVSMPYDVHYSNNITEGSVSKIDRESLMQIETNFTPATA